MKTKKIIYELSVILFSCMLIVIGLNLFLAEAKLLSGGVTGIAFLIEYTTNMNAGIFYLLLNLPLFVLSYFKVSLKFTIYSILCTLLVSTFLYFTSDFKTLLKLDDPFLRGIFGGAISGIGYASLFKVGASTGGIDIIAIILRKKNPALNIGDLGFIVNLIIVLLSIVLLKDISTSLYSLLSMFVTTTIVNKLVIGFNRKYLVLITTKSPDKIKDYIINTIKRGVTYLDCEGGYTREKQNMLYTVIDINQYVALKNMMPYLDPNSFLCVTEVRSVTGNGFNEV